MEEKIESNKYDKIIKLIMIAVISGILGFIYEIFFYKIDLGYFVKRGSTIGPWIPIYAIGGMLIYLLTNKYKSKPVLVFLAICLITGILEFGTGYALYHLLNIRLWDYNVEILNFGNIGGYICLRSILFFGVSGMCLNYLIVPLIEKIKNLKQKKYINIIFIILGITFLVDSIYSGIRLILK